jgi:hypothetical protein
MVSELSSLFDPTFVPPPPKFESTGNGNFGNTNNAGDTNSGYSNQKPPYASANLGSKPPKTWLAESILVTLFCCWPFGIPAIVNAAKVENRFYAGDIEGSMRASDAAKKWTLLSFWLGLAMIVLYIILMSFGLLGGLFFL